MAQVNHVSRPAKEGPPGQYSSASWWVWTFASPHSQPPGGPPLILGAAHGSGSHTYVRFLKCLDFMKPMMPALDDRLETADR